MKKSFSLSKTALAVASGSFFALSAPAYAENDKALVEITGQISPTTCVLYMAESADGDRAKTSKTLDLGNIKSGTNGFGPGKTFGTAKKVVFTLSARSGETTPCRAATDNARWNVVLGFAPDSVAYTTTGGTFAKNQGKGGTDAWLALSDVTTSTTTPSMLTLKETMGYTGTTVSKTDRRLNQNITLQAQLAYPGTTAASVGPFVATIPLLVVYK